MIPLLCLKQGVVLHGVAGCAFAEASGGDCAAGAAGGIAQSLYAGYLGRNGLTGSEYIKTASLIGGTVGFFFSGGVGTNVGLGSTVAASGLKNNYLSHQKGELQQFQEDMGNCQTSDNIMACEAAVYAWAQEKSDANNAEMAACGSDYQCLARHHNDIAAGDDVRTAIMKNTAYMMYGTGGYKSLQHVESMSLMLDAEYGGYVEFGLNRCNGASSADCQLYYAWESGFLPLPPGKDLNDIRNAFNAVPDTLGDMFEFLSVDPNASFDELEDLIGKGFIKLPEGMSIFHMQGEGGGNNIKFVSDDGSFEAVYNAETGEMITDAVNQGTYNFRKPSKFGENPLNFLGHALYDVVPYYLYGTGSNDPTNLPERLVGSYEYDVNLSPEQREALFGDKKQYTFCISVGTGSGSCVNTQ